MAPGLDPGGTVAARAQAATVSGGGSPDWYDNQERLPEHISSPDDAPGPSAALPECGRAGSKRRSGDGNPRASADLVSPRASASGRESGGPSPQQPPHEQHHAPAAVPAHVMDKAHLVTPSRKSILVGRRASFDQPHGAGSHISFPEAEVTAALASAPAYEELQEQPVAPRAKSRRSSFLSLFSGKYDGDGQANSTEVGSIGRQSASQFAVDGDLPVQPVAPRAKSRRSSFLALFGGSMKMEDAPGATGDQQGDQQGGDDPTASASNLRAKSERMGVSMSKNRRSSFAAFFDGLSSRKLDSSGGADEDQQGPQRAKSMGVGRAVSRRGSFAAFFDGGPMGSAKSMSAAQGGNLMPSVSGKSRRASMVDLLSKSSKKGLALLAKMVNRDAPDQADADEAEEEDATWFTSMNDFKPLTYMYHRGKYVLCFFACAKKTGEHHVLKQYEKHLMSMTDLRGVRRALAFGQLLEHENLVKIKGTWETEDALCIVEEYASKGDVLQDSMSHPERYTEAFMALNVVKPLLTVLVYLHQQKIIHRSIYPENVMFGRDSKLRLGHLTTAIDMRMDQPTERFGFLDYQAPEMLSVKDDMARAAAMAARNPASAAQLSLEALVTSTHASRRGDMTERSRTGDFSTHLSQEPLSARSGYSVNPRRMNTSNPDRNPEFYAQLSQQDPGTPMSPPMGVPLAINPRRSNTANPDRNPEFYASMSAQSQDLQLGSPVQAPMDGELGSPATRSQRSHELGHLSPMVSRINPRRSSTLNPNRNPDFDLYASQHLSRPASPPLPATTGSLLSPGLAEAAAALPSPRVDAQGRGQAVGESVEEGVQNGHPPAHLPTAAAPPFMMRSTDGRQFIELPASMSSSVTSSRSNSGSSMGVMGTQQHAHQHPRAAAVAASCKSGPGPVAEAHETVPSLLAAHAQQPLPSSAALGPAPGSGPLWPTSGSSGPVVGAPTSGASAASATPAARPGVPSIAQMIKRGLTSTFKRKQSHDKLGLVEDEDGPGGAAGGSSTPAGIHSPDGDALKRRGSSVLDSGRGNKRVSYGGNKAIAASGPSGTAQDSSIIVPVNPWEWQDSYDEKVDIWQVGCFVHEVLTGTTPFEVDDKVLAASLILWADITSFPDTLSTECGRFIQACLTKDPKERPSAADLLKHPWITRHEAGEILQPVKVLKPENSTVSEGGGKGGSSWLPAWASKALSFIPGFTPSKRGSGGGSQGADGVQESQRSQLPSQRRGSSTGVGAPVMRPLAPAPPPAATQPAAVGPDGHHKQWDMLL